LLKVILKTGNFLLGLLQFIVWLIFCGIPAGILYIVHCLWISRRFFRQVRTKKPQCLDSPVYALIELLVLLPMVLSMTP